MKTIQIGNKDYVLEFTFEAAGYKPIVQKMFNALSGSYIFKRLDMSNEENKTQMAVAMADGTADLVSEIPHICMEAFYAGLLENNPVSLEESKNLMKEYMKANKLSFRGLYNEIKSIMEDDGFFDLAGLTEALEEMNKAMENGEEKPKKRVPKTPQDHKKSTSGK